MKVLIVIDMQKDFLTGSLANADGVAVIENVKNVINHFDGMVVFTRDTHQEDYLTTNEGKHLPVEHCLLGTEGHKIVPELLQAVANKPHLIYNKYSFGMKNIAQKLKTDVGKIDSIELCGVCTDICVVSNALILKANFPEIPIAVRANCCAGITKQKHNSALDVMQSCQIEIL